MPNAAKSEAKASGKDETRRVAAKVIDPRGNEGMRVVLMSGRY